MARLPTSAEIPLVNPQPSNEIPTYRGGIGADMAAQAFGQDASAALQGGDAAARGLSQLAQGSEQAINASDAINSAAAEGKFLTQLSALRSQAEADPDYATVPQRYGQQVQQLGSQAASGITGAVAKADFQNRIARYQNFANDTFGEIAKQRSVAADRTYVANYMDGISEQYARAPDDVTREGLLNSASTMLQGMAAKGSITPQEMQAYAKQTNESMQTGRAQALVATNPAAAAKLLAPSSTTEDGEPVFASTGTWIDHLPPNVRAPLYEKALEQSNALTARTEANKYTGAASPTPVTPLQPVTSAILDQESGNGATSQNIGQIQPATWAQYAKPGENINNPDDNRVVTQRVIADLSAKTNGDPARIAVGYFSGIGNVAPAGSPTPWLHDVADANGKTTSSYVQDVTTRMGAMAKAGVKMDEATALAQIDKDYATNPALGRAVKQEVVQRYQNVAMAAAATQAQQTAASEQSADNITKRIMAGDPTVMDTIRNDPSLEWQTRARLGDMAMSKLAGNSDKDTQTYGPGFWKAFQGVTAPAGDPSRITDPNQLRAMAGTQGGLTVAGYDKLNGILSSKNSPDGEANSAVMKGALAYAKHQLSFEQDFGVYKIPDPKGEDAFNIGFTPAFFKYWDDGIKAGKSPYELADQAAIDKVIQPFKRSQAQLAQDFSNAGIEAGAGGATPPNQTAPLDTIPPPMSLRVPGKTEVHTAKGQFIWQADGWHPVQ